jgi:cation transport ATPase
MILELFALGGLVYAGRKALPRRKPRTGGSGGSGGQARRLPEQPKPPVARRELTAASVSLGLAVSGAALGSPLLGLASLPGMLFVFVPTYAEAWRLLRQRRVGREVLDAARVTVCVAMGYVVIAALDALLNAAGRRLFRRGEEDFRDTLDEAFGSREASAWVYCDGVELQTKADDICPGAIVVLSQGDVAPAAGVVLAGQARVRPRLAPRPVAEKRRGDPVRAGSLVVSGRLYVSVERKPAPLPSPHEALERAALGTTAIQRLGERSGDHMASWMLAAFVLSTPWLGVNRAAAFLTTSFGGQLRQLSPHTNRQAIGYAARHGILVREARALERAFLVNTLVFDARVLSASAVRAQAEGLVHALRQRPWPAARLLARPFAVHVLADSDGEGRRLQAELGLDDYFVEPSAAGRATLIQNLQLGGRCVCYVGAGEGDEAAMRTALLAVAHRPHGLLGDTPAAIVLTGEDLLGLPGLFDLAAAFTARQGNNLSTPIGMDLIDISTTLFLHFGLIYSVLLSHAGLLSSAVRARFPRAGPCLEWQAEPPPETAGPGGDGPRLGPPTIPT